MEGYKETLIELVRARPLLWNPCVPEYKDKNLKAQVWEDLAKILPEPKGTTHKDMWLSLTRCHCNALRRTQRKSCSGAADSSKPWKFMKQMDFLIPVKDFRNSKGNLFWSNDEETEAFDCFPAVVKEEPVMDVEPRHGEDTRVTFSEQAVAVAVNRRRGSGYDVGMAEKRQCSDYTLAMAEQRQCSDYTLAVADKRQCSEREGGKQKRKKVEDNEDQTTSMMREQPEVEVKPESPRMGFFRSIMPRVDNLQEDLFQEFQFQTLLLLRSLHTQQNQRGHFSL